MLFVLWGAVLEVPELEDSVTVQGSGTITVDVDVDSGEEDQGLAGYVVVGDAPVDVPTSEE